MSNYQIVFKVKRFYQNKDKTLSICTIELENGRILMDDFCGIELPWKNNKRNISCILAGTYRAIAVRRYSNRKYALWIQDVPGRSEIMVHTANFVRSLLGCLAPGREFKDIDNDGLIDVSASQDTMDEIQKYIPLGTEIRYEITDSTNFKATKLPPVKKLLKLFIPFIRR